MSVKIGKELETAEVTVLTENRRFGCTRPPHVGDVIEVLGFTMVRLHGPAGTYYREICGSCAGTGYRPGYGYVDGSRCWPCAYSGLGALVGRGTAEELIIRLRRRQRAAQLRTLARKTKAENEKNSYEDWASKHETLMAAVQTVRTQPENYSGILQDLANRAGHHILTDKQQTLLAELFIEENLAIAAKADARERKTHLGGVGERITVTGTVVYSNDFTTYYGYSPRTSTLYIIETADGQTVKWFRSGYFDPPRGTLITVTATIKELGQDEERGKFTQITRGKVSQEVEPESAGQPVS